MCDVCFFHTPDGFRRVDDLFDPRHAQRDVHRRHAGEVERLERHLRARLADALRRHGADGGARLDLGAHVLVATADEKLFDLRRCDALQLVQHRRHAVVTRGIVVVADVIFDVVATTNGVHLLTDAVDVIPAQHSKHAHCVYIN